MHWHVEVHMSNGLGQQPGDLLIPPSSSDSVEGPDVTLYVGGCQLGRTRWWEWSLAPPGKYDSMVPVWQRCGLPVC